MLGGGFLVVLYFFFGRDFASLCKVFAVLD
jgi:hypothetical protein